MDQILENYVKVSIFINLFRCSE